MATARPGRQLVGEDRGDAAKRALNENSATADTVRAPADRDA
jgi:hypothetical protein